MVLGLFKPSAATLAIDFGYARVKVLQLSAEDQPSVIAAASLDVPESIRANKGERAQFLLEELPRVLARGGFRAKTALCSIPSWQTYVQHMQITKVERESLEQALKQQLQLTFGIDPDQVVVRHVEVGQSSRRNQPGTEVICFAIGHDIVMSYVDLLRKMRLEVGGLHAEPVAITQAFRHVNRREHDLQTTTIYIDIGAGNTKVMIAHGNDLRFARSIAVGGRHFDQRLATTMHCDVETARRHRIEAIASRRSTCMPATDPELPSAEQAGAVLAATARVAQRSASDSKAKAASAASGSREGDGLIAESLQPLHDQLCDEVQMCLRYHLTLFPERPVNRVIFMGGESVELALCTRIAQVVGAPAFIGNPFSRLKRTGSEKLTGVERLEDASGWEVPIGLCSCRTVEAA